MPAITSLGGERQRAVIGSAETPQNSSPHAVLWTVIAQTLPPLADTHARVGAYAAQNLGTARTLLAKMGVSADNTRRTYLKFDVSRVNDHDG
jgi:hypothetical protein